MGSARVSKPSRFEWMKRETLDRFRKRLVQVPRPHLQNLQFQGLGQQLNNQLNTTGQNWANVINQMAPRNSTE